MKMAIPALAVLLVSGGALAQSSASFDLEEYTLNSGGHPLNGTVLGSASFRISLDSIGDSVATTSMSSASFGLHTGFPAAYPPPREVEGLVFSSETTLEWTPERSVGVYNLYRALISDLAGGGFGSCEQSDLVTETATDNDPVPSSDGFFYLVTAENRLAEEGTKGFRSSGVERANAVPCP